MTNIVLLTRVDLLYMVVICGVGCRQVCVATLHGSNWCDVICQTVLQLSHDRHDLLDQLLMLWGAV